MKDKFKKIRSEIDEIDQKVLSLITKRFQLAIDISKEKQKLGYKDNFYSPEREAEVLNNIAKLNKGPAKTDDILRIYREIMSVCLSLESPLKISYLGPQGTYTQVATQKHFGKSAEALPLASITDVFLSVENNDSHYGVVPIENSSEGIVTMTIDMFMSSDLKICGEIEIDIHHNFLSKNKDIEKIKKLYAHPQTFAQCREWIGSNLENISCISVSSNGEAARLASEDSSSAAIANIEAAEIYDLNILRKNIEESHNNVTRFLVIGKDLVKPSGNDKTSILVSAKNDSGALYNLLEPLAKNKVSMSRIESRPSKHNNWEYIFFLDIEGHIDDKSVQKANIEIQEKASLYKILGSYPRAINTKNA